MPPVANPHCKFEGCAADRHIYPGGGKAQFCSVHLKHRKSAKRNGLDSMTGLMKDILRYLRDMKKQEHEWVELGYPFAHGKTINGLIERDWIFGSPGLDGVRYKITGRGEDALEVYEPQINRRDGICPRCNTSPRHTQRNGRLTAFCLDCERAFGREKRLRYKTVDRSNRCCPRCNKRQRHQYPGGGWSAYCAHCAKVLRRKNARKERRRAFQAVQAGQPVPICPRCKSQPVTVFENCLSKHCFECRRVYVNRRSLRAAKQFMKARS